MNQTSKAASYVAHLGRARRHLEASGLSPRMVSVLLILWVDQVEREDSQGVTLKEWIVLFALWAGAEEQKRIFEEMLNALPKMLRSGRVVRESHSNRPQTYRLIMPRSFQKIRKPEEEPWA